MNKFFFAGAFAAGLAILAWIAAGFTAAGWLPLAITLVIAATYLLGSLELQQFRRASAQLSAALATLDTPPASLPAWLEQVPAGLRSSVRLRVEGERSPLPGPALTPYLVGLLVMLGMLGTFLGMVATFKGAVFALEGSTGLEAIRAALAAPLRGLGLSFGTSVAGVAASSMLGLMAALSRRERIDAGRELDARIASVLRPFSAVHQRQEGLRALQAQAGALPAVAEALQALMERIEQRSALLDEQLRQRQADFQREVTVAYGELAQRVGASLQDSLRAAAQSAGDTIRPVVESAMAQVVQESRALHARLGEVAQEEVETLSRRFAESAQGVAQNWDAALRTHREASDTVTRELRASLSAFTGTFDERSAALVAAVDQRFAQAQAEQLRGEQQRLQAWTETLQASGNALQQAWQQAGEQALAQHRQVAQALQGTATQWRGELAGLRDEERVRGEAAVARLGELEAAVARHLGTLGAALEAPITRLLQTASEVPQAAAGVITQLREQMGQLAQRDNLALRERTQLLEQVGTLLQGIEQAAAQQKTATEALVDSATRMLEQAGAQHAQALQGEAQRSTAAATQLASGAADVAQLAQGFTQGVQQFHASSERLMETLQRIEAALQKSTARSDEQLAYYVAQAREVIDLSIASQQGLVDNLRQLQGRERMLAEGSTA